MQATTASPVTETPLSIPPFPYAEGAYIAYRFYQNGNSRCHIDIDARTYGLADEALINAYDGLLSRAVKTNKTQHVLVKYFIDIFTLAVTPTQSGYAISVQLPATAENYECYDALHALANCAVVIQAIEPDAVLTLTLNYGSWYPGEPTDTPFDKYVANVPMRYVPALKQPAQTLLSKANQQPCNTIAPYQYQLNFGMD